MNAAIQPLPDLGAVIVQTNNPDDMKALVALINIIQKYADNTEINIEVMRLGQADATSIAATLQAMYTRVVVGPNYTTIRQGAVGDQEDRTGRREEEVAPALQRVNRGRFNQSSEVASEVVFLKMQTPMTESNRTAPKLRTGL